MSDENVLADLAKTVIVTMHQIPQLDRFPVHELQKIPLGRLRRDATRLHAVCRYQKGIRKSEITGPDDVRCVDVAGVYQLSDRFCSRWNLNSIWCDRLDVGRIFAYRVL